MLLASILGWYLLCANGPGTVASTTLPHICTTDILKAYKFNTQAQAEAYRQTGERVISHVSNR